MIDALIPSEKDSMMNLVRNRLKRNLNLGGKQTRDNNNNSAVSHEIYEDSEEEEEVLPAMIESPGASTSSSSEELRLRISSPNKPSSPSTPPQLYSSSSRMQQRFAQTLRGARSIRKSSPSPGRKGHRRTHSKNSDSTYPRSNSSSRSFRFESPLRDGRGDEPSDSSILKGAEILRRQLSHCDSPLRAPSPLRTSIDRENWDPWKTDSEPGAAASSSPKNGNAASHQKHRGHKTRESPKNKNKRSTSRGRSRVQEILENGDNYFGSQEESMNKSVTFELPQDEPRPPRMVDCLVQRVSEMDDSTFASSGMGNGYLPNNIMSGLTCGGLNTAVNTAITNCSNPMLTPQSLLDPKPKIAAATPEPPHIPEAASMEGEELETSTLDFLANLHTREEDLNFIFTNLEEEQAELCAQSPTTAVRSTPETPQNNPLNIVPPAPPAAAKATKKKKKKNEIASSSFVTTYSKPFEKMLSSNSSLHDKLMKDPGYTHALKAGTLWQSLCSQHVRFPAHWWDGQEPIGPPLGSSKKRRFTNLQWSYLGRHRVQGDFKLNKLIGNRASSGRILLHLIVRDVVSGKPIEDIACGCYHPNARGVRTTPKSDPSVEDCRDVWIAHRRRYHDPEGQEGEHHHDDEEWTTIESLLLHQNKGRVHDSPLGSQGGKHSVTNQNLRIVFGSKPPVVTAFCLESDLYEVFQEKLDGSIPASVALLRHYLMKY